MRRRASFVLAGALVLAGGDARAAERPAEQRRGHVGVKVEAGAAYRLVFDEIKVLGPEAALAIGNKIKFVEGYAQARYSYGRTEHGLTLHVARLGVQVELPFDRFRPFLGAGVLWMAFERATERGIVQHWGIGANFGATVDLLRTRQQQALYLGARFDADVVPHKLIPREVSPSGSLFVGYRF